MQTVFFFFKCLLSRETIPTLHRPYFSCDGTAVGPGVVATEGGFYCEQLCDETPECNWYTWDSATKFCTLTDACVLDLCVDCVYGERDCLLAGVCKCSYARSASVGC